MIANEMLLSAAPMAALGAALLLLGFVLGSGRRTSRREMRKLFASLDESRNDTRSLAALTGQLAGNVTDLEARLTDRALLAAASVNHGQRGYDIALQLARSGATPEDIITASGVTRKEANLLARIHGPQLN
jgi:alkylhydroperoxidase family enzyme